MFSLSAVLPQLRHISGKLMAWAARWGIHIQYIQPENPQQNAYVERYNRMVRHEWLDQNIFETIEKAQKQSTKWLWTYNNDRPNIGIGGFTPAMKLKMAVQFYKRTPLNGGLLLNLLLDR